MKSKVYTAALAILHCTCTLLFVIDEKDKVMGKAKELHILKERIKNMEESIRS